MPGGSLVTVPLPVLVIVSRPATRKVARTVFASLIVTVQSSSVPAQAPDQLSKAEPVSGVACSVTLLLGAKVARHSGGQSIVGDEPGTPPLTWPVPLPATETVSVGSFWKVAVRVVLRWIVKSQFSGSPAHGSLQPAK